MHQVQSNTEEYSLLLFCVGSRARSGARLESPAALAPPLASQGTNAGNEGFSYHEEVKYAKKSSFLKDFYKGGKRVQY